MNIDVLIANLLIGPLMLVISLIYYFFPPKKINPYYGHRTKRSMKNDDTWREANHRSAKIFIWISFLTIITQTVGLIMNFNGILSSSIVLILGILLGVLVVENKLKTIFDDDGKRIHL